MSNIKIREIAIYHGDNMVDNDYYLEHYKKQGKDTRYIKRIMENLSGRKSRFLIDEEKENANTMAVDVAKKVLVKSGLQGSDMDMIILSAALPEYVSPIGSMVIHNAVKGKENCFCFDLNANCAGMVHALNLVDKYMQSDSNINKVLIVGSDYLNMVADPENPMSYGQYGDAACAIILERAHNKSRVLGTKVEVLSNEVKNIVYPKCGFSKIYDAKKEDIVIYWNFTGLAAVKGAVKNMEELLAENNLTKDDVSMFCLSQVSYGLLKRIRTKLDIPAEKSLYIGDKYGYTGTSSPFIAFFEALKDGKIHRGDYVMFWTIAAGLEHIALLLQY